MVGGVHHRDMPTNQTTQPLVRQNLQAMNRSAREMARMVTDGHLDLNPPYQRGSVWTHAQRVNLVRSWLLGVPVPAVIINDRDTRTWRESNGEIPMGEPIYGCVDGKQRIETAIEWFEGPLAVPASWFPADGVETTEDTEDGSYVRFSGLTLVEQRGVSFGSSLPMVGAKVTSVREEAELYLLVNGAGTVQTNADLANAAHVAS